MKKQKSLGVVSTPMPTLLLMLMLMPTLLLMLLPMLLLMLLLMLMPTLLLTLMPTTMPMTMPMPIPPRVRLRRRRHSNLQDESVPPPLIVDALLSISPVHKAETLRTVEPRHPPTPFSHHRPKTHHHPHDSMPEGGGFGGGQRTGEGRLRHPSRLPEKPLGHLNRWEKKHNRRKHMDSYPWRAARRPARPRDAPWKKGCLACSAQRPNDCVRELLDTRRPNFVPCPTWPVGEGGNESKQSPGRPGCLVTHPLFPPPATLSVLSFCPPCSAFLPAR